jgi:DNA-binding transcriptional ArsR family regulator
LFFRPKSSDTPSASEEWGTAADGAKLPLPWSFLSNHGQELPYVNANPDARLREIADAIQITERPLHRILSELVEAGYVTRERRGRRVRYTVNADMNLRGAYVRDLKVRDLLTLADRL